MKTQLEENNDIIMIDKALGQVCSVCGKYWDFGMYTKHPKGGHFSYCKSCKSNTTAKQREKVWEKTGQYDRLSYTLGKN